MFTWNLCDAANGSPRAWFLPLCFASTLPGFIFEKRFWSFWNNVFELILTGLCKLQSVIRSERFSKKVCKLWHVPQMMGRGMPQQMMMNPQMMAQMGRGISD